MEKDKVVYSSEKNIPKKNKNQSKNTDDKKYKRIADGFIRIQLEKNKRGGKTVCVIYNFDNSTDIESIGKELKKKTGTGGTVKENQIVIQGDKREAIEKHLQSLGYKTKFVGG